MRIDKPVKKISVSIESSSRSKRGFRGRKQWRRWAKQLFGTDGIRGVAGEFPLDAAATHAFGIALGTVVRRLGPDPKVVIGMDTRESGPWIAAQVAGGLEETGVGVQFAGVVTTPGVAFLTRADSFVAGVMISASHNPYRDNGIKVFGHSGYKLPDAEEHAIEEEIFRLLASGVEPAPAQLSVDEGLDRRYLGNLLSSISTPLPRFRLAIDCGNGAASRLAPELFRRAGAEVIAIGSEPDGRNINLGCGALYPGRLRERPCSNTARTRVWPSMATRTVRSSSRSPAASWMATPCC